MGAGEHNRVDPITLRSVEQRLRCRPHRLGRDLLPGELRLCKLDEFRRAVTNDRAVGGELRSKIVDIGLADGRFGAQYADDASS